MGKKYDMYIDYERSYRRRKRLRKNRTGMVILIIILILVLGTAVVLFFRDRIDIFKEKVTIKQSDQDNIWSSSENEAPDITPVVTTQPTITDAAAPTQEPTLTPTITPAPVVTTPAAAVSGDGVLWEDNRTPAKVKGIYVTASAAGTKKLSSLVSLVETSELNAMVIDVKGDEGKISYRMESPLAKEIEATTNTISDMANLVKTLKDKNIYLIARIVAFKDPYLAEKRQDLAIKNKDGSLFRDNNGEGWVNPYKQEIWEYLVEVAAQAAALGFDEIQFDYIRFSTGKGISDADFGEEAENKSKEDIITEFTKYACEQLKPLGVFVSADVYGTIINSSVDAALVGQNYVEMAKYLDYICPMIYPSHFGEGNYGIQYPDLEPYNIIQKVLTASKEKLAQLPEDEHKAIVRPWLQDFTATWIKKHQKYGADELREQMEGVYSVGYDEWILWNASNNYTEEGLLRK